MSFFDKKNVAEFCIELCPTERLIACFNLFFLKKGDYLKPLAVWPGGKGKIKRYGQAKEWGKTKARGFADS